MIPRFLISSASRLDAGVAAPVIFPVLAIKDPNTPAAFLVSGIQASINGTSGIAGGATEGENEEANLDRECHLL
jgi:hypothetical protein